MLLRTNRPISPVNPRRVAALFAGSAFLYGAIGAIAIVMRAVIQVGGACGSGGPYAIATPCPDGVGWMIFATMAGAIIGIAVLVSATRMGAGPSALLLAWTVLFGWLGFNFFDGALPGGDGQRPVGGWLICAVAFVLMAVAPLLLVLSSKEGRRGLLWGTSPNQIVDSRIRVALWVVALAGIACGVVAASLLWSAVR